MPKARAKSKINPKFVIQREKEAEALRLVKEGFRLPEIAQKLGFSNRQGAHNLITRALQTLTDEPREDARKVCVARLDNWLTKLADQIDAGDLKAIGTALKIEERRARLLGLDAPVAIHTQNGGPLVQFVVALPPQALSVAEWQAQALPVIDVTPQGTNGDAA